MKKIWLSLLLLLATTRSFGQILNDPPVQQMILKALDGIYNYQFDTSENYQRQIRSKYPQSPVGPLLKAIQLYWQYLPLRDNKTVLPQYVQQVTQGLDLARRRLDRDSDDPEGVFFALTAHGYLAMKYNYDNETMKAVNEAKKAYGYMKQGFKLTEKNAEFYFTTGLYNYYVERYPMDHPIVRPVMWFFQDGNMAQGLGQMETAVRRGIFTRTETSFYLSHIYLEHESQPAKAAAHLKTLADRYPNNPLFTMRCAEALLLANRPEEAGPYLQRTLKMPQKLLDMPGLVLQGMLYERDGQSDKATSAYQAALKIPFSEEFTREFHGHALAGLARLAARSGNKNLAKQYYRKMLDVAQYKSNLREARAYLKE
ncbi:tetratricopeptide repeat protein [Tellurirhabdus rosea]|uniref:tetratricopeptide repeat protein n=1 Tax=Tellurirhabdus rosea TaxID=2674997 RepID=UPI00225B983A|nr:tetratricopeptide repeat protein [Tellurirhabdus rosea]